MNLGELRDVIRDTLESDNDEFSDTLLDTWIREGWLHIHRHSDWPFLDTTWTLATSLTAVDFGQITDLAGAVPKDVRSVRSADGPLTWLNPSVLQDLLADGTGSNVPTHWGVRGGRTLLLGPDAPTVAINYVIQGYRKPLEWMTQGVSSIPDLPEGLHVALYQWALGRAFQRLDEPQSAVHFLDMAQFTIESVDVDTSSAQFGGSMIIGGGHGVRDRDVNTSRTVDLREPRTRVV